MKKRALTLITGSEQTRKALLKQLKEYISDIVTIDSYAVDENITEKINTDLVVLSSAVLNKELKEMNLLPATCRVIIAKRTISYEVIDQIVFLPEDTDVLFVNDIEETTMAGINALREIGIDYLNFVPYYPGIGKITSQARIAITPGEIDKIPSFVEQVYDIGPRIMDFTTLIKILRELNILQHKAGQFSRKYLQKIIKMSKKLAGSANAVTNLNKNLNMIINGLNEALIAYNNQGQIIVANDNFKKNIININYKSIIGSSLKDILYNKELLTFLMNKQSSENGKKIFKLNEIEFLINRFNLPDTDYLVAVFKSVEETIKANKKIRRELVKKGFYAKYKFSDIIGDHNTIKRTKNISQKLAQTDLTILIEGESGTGKELFASAIHNYSKRKNKPFLAVNFSALPDELIESELFGYEEGAFTGARKGGKPGLFEQADGGTIFLDEIGDVSSKVQARLLRVLEEKEVMRIGGSKIKTVDVRIVAATNRDLARLVKEGKLREDLYYRLKMGYIKIPPLRERKEDIAKLIYYFTKIERADEVKVSQEVIEELLQFNWYGNIRELKNTINYMLAVSNNNVLSLKDIPEKDFLQKDTVLKNSNDYNINDEELFILKLINKLNKQEKVVGRRLLAQETQGSEFKMTEYQMRNRLEKLAHRGLVIKKRGQHGTVLSQNGKSLIT